MPVGARQVTPIREAGAGLGGSEAPVQGASQGLVCRNMRPRIAKSSAFLFLCLWSFQSWNSGFVKFPSF